ncbi:MAG: helix-turn-helix domain-containing protein [Ruminococcus flavefaciens]
MADQNEPKKARLDRPYAGRRSMQETTNSDAEKEIPVLCRQIRFYREKKGIEQKELAAKVGIKSNAVSNWENGRTRPDIALLPLICQVLDVSLDELFDIKKSSTEPIEEEKPAISMTKSPVTEEDILLEGFQQLSEGHRSVVSSMVRQLCDVEDQELYNSISEETFFSKGLCAGFDAGVEYEDQGEPIHLYKSKVHPLMDCVFPVSGDSMEPDFHNGDLVMVQRLSDRSDLYYGEIGAFSVRNETYIKQYGKRGLVSLNKKYKLMRFQADESVYLIGRVLGVLDPSAIVSYEDMQRYERIKKRMESDD